MPFYLFTKYMKKNCWEFKNCGREPGGVKVVELGECPAAVSEEANGLNGGVKGGRICWAVSGTFCGGKKQGTFAQKQASCMACEFYNLVTGEEGDGFKLLMPSQDFEAIS